MNGKEWDYIQAWIRKGDNDLKNAELILRTEDEESPYDTVCFHCQQAVEKYLKGYLTSKGIKFPMTHNLADLIRKCETIDPDFTDIEVEAELLTPFSVEIRYPDDFYLPVREEAEEAYCTAVKLRGFICSRLVAPEVKE